MPDNLPPDEPTLPSRPAYRTGDALRKDPPVLLQQYFNGEIQLERELASLYGSTPLMSMAHFRVAGSRTKRAVALLATQDGAAGLRVEVDGPTRATTFTFTIQSTLGLTFMPPRLSDLDRATWFETIRRADEVAFLWGQARWEADYLIFAPQKHFSTIYAFSAHQTEAAARLTGEVHGRLIDWLERLWR